jgi:hypothetical protein
VRQGSEFPRQFQGDFIGGISHNHGILEHLPMTERTAGCAVGSGSN